MTGDNFIDTVIFDLGNVVLDWDIEKVLASLQLGEAETSALRRELFLHPDWQDMDHGAISEAGVVDNVQARTALPKPVVESAFAAARRSLTPIDATLVLMREISDHGTRMLCLSNISRENYAHIEGMEFFAHFSGVVISGIECCMKPDPDIFHLVVDRYGLTPTRTLFIDDIRENIEAAGALGIRGFHFKRSQQCYAALRRLIF